MDTKKEILKRAQFYIQMKGYNGFSLQDIANDIGIRKASLFYHFKSKEVLVVTVIQNYRIWFSNWMENQNQEQNAEVLFDLTFDIYRTFFLEKKLLCPLTMLSSEYENLTDSIKVEVDLLLKSLENWFELLIESGKKKNQINSSINSNATMKLIMSTLSGLLNLCRLESSKDSFETSIEMLKKMVLVREHEIIN
jgi:TetR/AcrR family transcriptional regulator, transcriptional repressor for nem operon